MSSLTRRETEGRGSTRESSAGITNTESSSHPLILLLIIIPLPTSHHTKGVCTVRVRVCVPVCLCVGGGVEKSRRHTAL